MKKILILGAGLVSKPIVQYLLDQNFELTVADYLKENAQSALADRKGGKAIEFDVNSGEELELLVKNHDLVVSLLPYNYHPKVARCAIKYGKNMLTASYVSPEMKSLDQEARNAGIIILNELGLDPGIDHMSAMKIIDEVHKKGNKIDEFYSYCGALSAPEYSDNPLKYKFTWSPRGVVMAARNNARYKMNGEIVNIPSVDLFKDIRWMDIPGIGKVEIYPNRDSLPYQELYGIQEAKTVLRGTIRYPGWSRIMDAVKSLDLLSFDEIDTAGKTFAGLIGEKIGNNNPATILNDFMRHFGISKDDEIVKAFEWLGLFEAKPVLKTHTTLFDILANQMFDRMMLGNNEKDMVLLVHTFKTSAPDGSTEIIRSRMIEYGSPEKDTAIARTVALPVAIGAKLILEKKIRLTGVHIPVMHEIYSPILGELEQLGIKMEEEYGIQ